MGVLVAGETATEATDRPAALSLYNAGVQGEPPMVRLVDGLDEAVNARRILDALSAQFDAADLRIVAKYSGYGAGPVVLTKARESAPVSSVSRAAARIIVGPTGYGMSLITGRRGIGWHTQGSGKSNVIATLSALARTPPALEMSVSRVVVQPTPRSLSARQVLLSAMRGAREMLPFGVRHMLWLATAARTTRTALLLARTRRSITVRPSVPPNPAPAGRLVAQPRLARGPNVFSQTAAIPAVCGAPFAYA